MGWLEVFGWITSEFQTIIRARVRFSPLQSLPVRLVLVCNFLYPEIMKKTPQTAKFLSFSACFPRNNFRDLLPARLIFILDVHETLENSRILHVTLPIHFLSLVEL
jgi:hypothetical protein